MREADFAVFCPNNIGRPCFSYEASQEAYDHFVQNIGFDIYKNVDGVIGSLKREYDSVFVLGFSVGATIAWRCCENQLCDGIVACYGSRIRDYPDLTPACPTLLLFAARDSFDVDYLAGQLQGKDSLTVRIFDAAHGFLDPFSPHYDKIQADSAAAAILEFLSETSK